MEDCWGEVEPKDYVAKKEKVADGMIQWFEDKTGIKVRDAIEEISIATPWTFCHYANTPQGAAYGYELRDWDAMHRHKVYIFGGGKLGSADKIALVFPVRIVRDENNFSMTKFIQCLFNRAVLKHFDSS